MCTDTTGCFNSQCWSPASESIGTGQGEKGTFIQIKAFVRVYWEQMGPGSGCPGTASAPAHSDS